MRAAMVYRYALAAAIAVFVIFMPRTLHAEQLCAAYGVTQDFNIQEPPETGFKFLGAPTNSGISAPSIRMNSKGGIVWWYATDGFVYRAQFSVASSAFLTEKLGAVSAEVMSAYFSSNKDMLSAVQVKYADTHLSDPSLLDVWCPHYAEMKAGTPPPIPYVVSINSTYTIRPTYPVVAGVRSLKGDGFSTVGAACDCVRQRVIEFTSTGKRNLFCAARGDSVSICNAK